MENSEMLIADFSNAKKGDRVKCLLNGEGTVTDVTHNKLYNIAVKFDEIKRESYTLCGELTHNIKRESYTLCGELTHNIRTNTLFYHFDTQFPTIEACTRPLPKIEVDEKVFCYNNVGTKFRRHFSHFDSKGRIQCYRDGKTSFSCKDGVNSDYWLVWKLASDETINSGNLH